MVSAETAQQFLANLESALEQAGSFEKGAQFCVELIAERLPHYNWVGIYWLQGDELVLGPYVGAPTDHTRIPVGRGVCGTAVAQNANQVIEDVRELDNYLACSLETRSEIVVLLHDEARNILGQIDADGHEVGAFDESDEALLEQIASRLMKRYRS